MLRLLRLAGQGARLGGRAAGAGRAGARRTWAGDADPLARAAGPGLRLPGLRGLAAAAPRGGGTGPATSAPAPTPAPAPRPALLLPFAAAAGLATAGLAAAPARAEAEAAVGEGAPDAPDAGEEKKCCAKAERQKLLDSIAELPRELVLYQYEVCPWCCKVKAVLDFYDIPYKVVEVHPMYKKELKRVSSHKKVPVLFFDDVQVNESDDIIDVLRRLKGAGKGGLLSRGPSKAALEEERAWRDWVNKRWIYVLTINIYETLAESVQTFDYITDKGKFSFMEKQAAILGGAGIMYFVGKNMQKKYSIGKHGAGDPRTELYACAEEWAAALDGRKFLGGGKPNLGDLAVFGGLRAILGTDTFRDLMIHGAIKPWYLDMEAAVGPSSRSQEE